LQISPLKIRPFLQKNRGPTEIILRICTPFSRFSGFSQSQALDLQPQAAIQPLQKKSCLKHYRRFFDCSRMCHNRRVNVELTGRNEGSAGWTAVKRRQPSLTMKSENPQRPYPSHFIPFVPSVPSVFSPRVDQTARTLAQIKPNQTQSNPIKVKTRSQQGLIRPEDGPNRQFLPLPVPGWTLNFEP
jgi:hypothetical protein